MKSIKTLRLIVCFMLIAALSLTALVGCKPAPDAQQGNTQEPAQSAGTENTGVSDETLKIALESNIAGLDPKTTVDRYSGNVYGCIYEPLLTYD